MTSCILCRGKGWTPGDAAAMGCPACTPTERPPPPPPACPAQVATLNLFAPPSLVARFEDKRGGVAAEIHKCTDGRYRVRVFDTDAGQEVAPMTMTIMQTEREARTYAKRCVK